jgi:hypothetical protein
MRGHFGAQITGKRIKFGSQEAFVPAPSCTILDVTWDSFHGHCMGIRALYRTN